MSLGVKDPVSTFLREARGAVARSDALLQRLNAEREAAQARMVARESAPDIASDDNSDDLIQELQLRDEELRTTVDELREHVDELERATELLERERMKYFDLFVHAPEAYVSTDVGGFIQDANLASAELLGSTPPLLVGRPLISFVARQDTRQFRMHLKSLDELHAEQEIPPTCQLRMRPRGQTPFLVALRATLVRALSSKLVAIRWNLCRADESNGTSDHTFFEEDVIGTLARELREPLATISGWAKLLRNGQVAGDEEKQQVFGWIERTADTQRAMLDELVNTLISESPGDNGSSVVVDLSEHVLKAISNVAPALERGRFAVKEPLPSPGEALVRSAPAQLERLIELLLHRSLDGTPRNGKPVTVRLWAAAGEAVVDIEAPEGASVPDGWEVRTTLAGRILRGQQGALVLNEASPSARIRLPLAEGGGVAGGYGAGRQRSLLET